MRQKLPLISKIQNVVAKIMLVRFADLRLLRFASLHRETKVLGFLEYVTPHQEGTPSVHILKFCVSRAGERISLIDSTCFEEALVHGALFVDRHRWIDRGILPVNMSTPNRNRVSSAQIRQIEFETGQREIPVTQHQGSVWDNLDARRRIMASGQMASNQSTPVPVPVKRFSVIIGGKANKAELA